VPQSIEGTSQVDWLVPLSVVAGVHAAASLMAHHGHVRAGQGLRLSLRAACVQANHGAGSTLRTPNLRLSPSWGNSLHSKIGTLF